MPDTAADDTPSKEQVLAMAQAFDRGEDVDAIVPDAPAPEKVTDPEPEVNAEADTPKAAVAEKAVSKEKPTEEPKKADTKAEPAKSKYAQNEERKNKTWEQINADKAALATEKAELAKEREALAQAKRAPANEPLRDEHGFTAKDYAQVAQKYREAGDPKTAAAAEQLASNMAQRDNQQRATRAQEDFVAAWKSNYEKVAEKNPTIKDKDSPLAKEVVRVLTEFPLLTRDVKGIEYATEAARLALQGKDFDGAKAEFEKLKAEHTKLQKKLSIAGGPPTGAPADDKPFEKMSLGEQRQYLERAVAHSDREAGLD